MENVANWLDFINALLGDHLWFPIVLLGVGIGFTVYLGFPQFRYFARAWRIFFGKEDKEGSKGDTSHFQALSTALSGTVGTGNIGGVAFALFLGGPAALFWMWATAFLGMTTKFVEVTLAHKYREVDQEGHISGGAMYFLEKRLNMKWLAVIFAIATLFCVLGTGNLPQANNAAFGIEKSFGIDPWITSLLLAILLGLVIIGGIRRIAQVTSKIVPFMGILYAIGAIAVIVTNYENIGPSFVSIFESVFTGSAAVGGFLGASFAYAFTSGVARGLFSNEAGQGSAPIAHASARADHPVPEGLVSLLEPFIDTLVICTLTGLAILASGVWQEKFENELDSSSTFLIGGHYSDTNPADVEALSIHLGLTRGEDTVSRLNGEIEVQGGRITSNNLTVISSRSITEDVVVFDGDHDRYDGQVTVSNGYIQDDVVVRGKSLIHSVPLSAEAFKRSIFGEWGQYFVTIGLLLFAFSTALTWSYYGDRAIVYLWGTKLILPYRILYCIAFFSAALIDTSVVWKIAGIAVVLMAVPNLLGICLLHKEMKETVRDFRDQNSS